MEERMSLKEMFIASRQELKKTSTLTITAVMIGLSAVLSMFTIVASQYLKISLFYLPVAVVGMLFGPVVSGLAGGIVDILVFLIKPTGAYFPGFTFDRILMGVIFGIFLYRRQPKWSSVITANLLVTLLVNLFFNTLWLWILSGNAIFAIIPGRIIKNVVAFPLEVVMLYFVVQFIWKSFSQRFF